MRAFPGFYRQKTRDFVSALCSALLAASLALASPTYAAAAGEEAAGEEEAGAGSGGGALNQAEPRAEVPSDLTVCKPGQAGHEASQMPRSAQRRASGPRDDGIRLCAR